MALCTYNTGMNTTSRTGAELEGRIEEARRAQPAWADAPVRQRLQPVTAFRRLLVTEQARLCRAIAADVGKSEAETIGSELLPVADACRFLEREAAGLLRPRRVPSRSRPRWLLGQSDTVYRRPRGVVAVIGTWNYPLLLNAIPIVQALTAGNAVVWKPSEHTPAFAELLGELLRQAGFPPPLGQVLPATRDLGPVLAEAAVDHVVFTGSAAVGRRLAARLGERLVSSTLELSGCDLQLVLADADLDLAARAAWFGATLNRGQTCIAVRRALVHRSLYSAFCDRLRALAVPERRYPLRLPAQLEQARRLVEDALQGGARLLAGDVRDGDALPLVLVEVRPEMAICREASFAPLLAVLPFDTVDEALAMDRLCPYALGASIFTRQRALAEAVAARLRAGSVCVNDVIVPTVHPALPFGGTAASGWGVTRGAEGLLAMTVPQAVSRRAGRFRPYYDTDPAKQAEQGELLRGFLEADHAPTLAARLRGWWRVIRSAWRGL